jgi:hypothetical protein
MIHYHGGPITPITAAMRVWRGRHAFVSFAAPDQIGIATEVCQSVAMDNGAFSVWKAGKTVDWNLYYDWVEKWKWHPCVDFALIPDVIVGTEDDNDRLISEWPHGVLGVPVWHLHETTERLERLSLEWPRIAIGSSGDFAVIGTQRWWKRMSEAMAAICDLQGRPQCKIHGLRMLDPQIVQAFPFSSADSTNVARNIGIDSRWNGTYMPASKETRAIVIAERIEQYNSPALWRPVPVQNELFGVANGNIKSA